MGLKSKLKKLLGGNNHSSPLGNNQLVINRRNDGLSNSGLPSFIAHGITTFPKSILCNDGTTLQLYPKSSLITGTSFNRAYVLKMQIASALCQGYTPVVLSSNGKRGEAFRALSDMYHPSAINYISDSNDSGYYDPFGGVSHNRIEEFFFQLVNMFQQQTVNSMLIRNYINVCVNVFFANSNAVGGLITGQLNHMRLIQEIRNMHIPEQQKTFFEDTANSAQSVSVTVLSVIQDYLFKMQRASTSRPSIQIPSNLSSPNAPRITIHGSNVQQGVPRITILNNSNQQVLPVQHTVQPRVSDGFNASAVNERKCFFLEVDNEVPMNFNNTPNVQCFQWYLSKTLQMEMDARPAIKNSRILLIVENISSVQLNWFWWLFDLPNSILTLNYSDFYSKLADASDRRQQLIGRMERIFFFSITDDSSAQWTSDFFGSRTVSKTTHTDLPPRDFWEMFFRQKSITHGEEEKPWFSKHEIRHLGDKGIVFSIRDNSFAPCYLEHGNTYQDKDYYGRVNFCTFSFK